MSLFLSRIVFFSRPHNFVLTRLLSDSKLFVNPIQLTFTKISYCFLNDLLTYKPQAGVISRKILDSKAHFFRIIDTHDTLSHN